MFWNTCLMRERRVGRSALPARFVAGAAGIAVLVTAAPPAYAQDEESGGGEVLCHLSDSRLENPAGITAATDGGGWWVVSSAENQDDTLSVMRVGEDCNVREADEVWIDHLPIDPQALALDAGGFVWVGDTGDAPERPWITVNQIEPGNLANNVIYRYVFPSESEPVEAFLITPLEGEKKPLFITAADGQANLFYPPGDNQERDTPLENVGTVALSEGGSVSGAALNAEGTKAALRTENAVYEWTVTDGNVIAALTETEPVVTPIADEGTPEGLTYGADGNFNTLSSGGSDGTVGTITAHTPGAPEAEAPVVPDEDDAAAEPEGPSFLDRILDLGFDTIVRILAGIAIVGMAVMIGGILVIRKYRKAQNEDEDDASELGFAAEEPGFGKDRGFDDASYSDAAYNDPVDLGIEAGHPDPDLGQVARGGVYGAARQEPSGSVYGGAASPAAPANDAVGGVGGVYGGPARPAPPPNDASGNVYGAPGPARPEPSGNVYGAASPARPERPGPGGAPGAGAVYGAPREEPQYGAFESGGNGSVYDNAGPGQSFGPPRPAPTPPPAESPGSVYGARPVPAPNPGGGGGGVYGGGGGSQGSVYGADDERRTPEPEDGYWGQSEGGATYGRGR